MTLDIYDTMSRKLRPIKSINNVVRMYCCGPTVYRDAHIGNLRTFLLSDLIRRTLLLLDFEVELVQNITDVGHMTEDLETEDKLISQARLENLDPFAIARKYEQRFHADLARLNILPAGLYPRASECIPLMQQLITQLIAKGNAYVGSDGSVYFDASSYPEYGQLSGNRLDSLKPGHRFDYSDDDGKRFHADWALWKAAGSRKEMIWDSPWGPGFPGWHIECSAMSLNFLHNHVEVHVGGIDLRFPHHENERAQSNVVTGTETVDLWVHGEHLLFQGRKMSKSSGNVVLLEDLIAQKFDPLALRLVFLENRYRSQMDLTWETIAAAQKTLHRWRELVNKCPAVSQPVHAEVVRFLSADLDTPRVIVFLRALEKDPNFTLAEKVGAFLFADRVLGLDLTRQEIQEIPSELSELIALRTKARAEKNWEESDRLREILESQGLIIEDTATGQNWKWS